MRVLTRRDFLGLSAALAVPFLSGCASQHSRTNSGASSGTAIPKASNALFEDIAAASGLRFVHSNGADGHFLFIESTPAGCAFFDYDNDGFLDILLVQSGSSATADSVRDRPHCALFHNNGDGTFTEVTSGSGLDKDLGYAHGVAVGDYDNDGYDDLFITSYGRNYLFRNERGTGKFTDVTAIMDLDKPHSTGYATSAAFGDYDNDGRLDLYVCYYTPWTHKTDKACHDGMGRQDYCTPEIYPEDTHQLFHNDGDRFTEVTEKAGIAKGKGRGLAVAFYDYDGDGYQDIFVANDLSANMLWHNNRDGTFTDRGVEAGCAYGAGGAPMAGMGIALADYDHSGHESLLVSNFSGLPNMLFKNTGQGLFEDQTAAAGIDLPHRLFLTFGCEFLDYDADGWPDIVNANGHVQTHADTTLNGVTYKERKQLFHNEGGGKFTEITDAARLGDLSLPAIARGLAVGDFDNNGRLDILANNQNGPAQLFRNRDQSANHWVSFKTVGVKSNRNGYHTRFVLKAGDTRQTATVRAGSSYLSHSDSRVYFGLGNNAHIAVVEIYWPGGTREVLKNIPSDAIYIVTEGRGITGKQPAAKLPGGRNL